MRKIIYFIILIICITMLSAVTVFAESYARPRVLTTRQGINEAIERIETDETVAGWYNRVKKKADSLLKTDLVPDNTDASDDIMSKARTIKDRVLSLGFVYFKTGNKEYAMRACREVLNACTFDWKHKTSPLGMAEMAFVVALGYDWLYDCFSDEELIIIENALMEKAIIPYYNYMMEDVWWGTVESNWNIVCNGGVLSAIIALDGKAGEIGDEAFSIGLDNINSMMPLFGPDGAWEEGLMYWRFTTEYFANFMSTLINYAGTDFGYCEWDGVDEIGYYPYYMTGVKDGFSYSDCIIRHENPPQVFWLASYFGDTALAGLRLNDMKKYNLGGEVRDILWYNGEFSEPVLEKDKSFGRVEAFCMRDTFENTDGVFLAGKGGQLGISHSHFDAGSFVLEALGERFVQDLGWEDYENAVEDRYQLYRNRAEGHNTLVVNPSVGYDQVRDTVSKIAAFESGENSAYSVLDLTPAYKDAIDIKRGFYFDRINKSILLQDEIILDKESDIWWFVHTEADITLSEDGKTAFLKIGEKQLDVKILGNNDYSFKVMDAKPFDSSLAVAEQNQNEGIKKLAININNVHNAIIRVSFTPQGSQEGAFREEVPIDCWSLSDGLFITEYQKTVAPGESFDFDAKLIDKEEVRDAMLAQWSLVKAHNGVSIDASTGVLRVSDTASEGTVTVMVRNGARTSKIPVKIAPVVFTLDSMPQSALVPSEGTKLTVKPKYSVRYKNGDVVKNKDIYTLNWSLKEKVDGVSIDEESGEITVCSNTVAEYITVIAELNSKEVISRKLYFTTKSLASAENGAIVWNLSGFGLKPQNMIDGDLGTYMDCGRHTNGSDTRIWIKLAEAPVLYNKVRVTLAHNQNTKEYMLTASDILVGDEPTQTRTYKDNAPILYPNGSPGGQMLYVGKKSPESPIITMSFPDMESKYIAFENKNLGRDEIPNLLINEIEVFNSTAGNAKMTINADDSSLIKCNISLYDTEGDAIKADEKGIWSIDGNNKGVSINQNGEITVMPWAEKKEITVCYTYTSDTSVVECRKTITAGFVEIKLTDGENEVKRLEGGKSYTAEFSGDGMYVVALYRISGNNASLYSVKLSGGTITVPDDGAEYEIKLMCIDNATLAPLCDFKVYGTQN